MSKPIVLRRPISKWYVAWSYVLVWVNDCLVNIVISSPYPANCDEAEVQSHSNNEDIIGQFQTRRRFRKYLIAIRPSLAPKSSTTEWTLMIQNGLILSVYLETPQIPPLSKIKGSISRSPRNFSLPPFVWQRVLRFVISANDENIYWSLNCIVACHHQAPDLPFTEKNVDV